MNRRVDSNHALQWAIQRANELQVPVLYHEGLACSYAEANDRLHTFILQGVPETARRLARRGIGYCFYLHRHRDDVNGILGHLTARAACVVTDDYPAFLAAHDNSPLPDQPGIAFDAVDSSCVVPMSVLTKREYAGSQLGGPEHG